MLRHLQAVTGNPVAKCNNNTPIKSHLKMDTQEKYMSTLLDRYFKLASHSKFLMISAAVYFLSQITIAQILGPLGELTVLELQTTFSPVRFLEIINHWQATDLMKHYYAHFTFDHIHPIWYSIFLSSLLAFSMKRDGLNAKYRILLLVPFIAGFCDVIENLSHVWFLEDLTRLESPVFYIAATACWIKWVGFIGSFVFALVSFIRYRLGNNSNQSLANGK